MVSKVYSKYGLTWLLVFVAALFAATMMMVCSARVLGESVRAHVLESASQFAMPRDLMGLRTDSKYSVQDHFTDALMAEEAMMLDEKQPLRSAMRCDFPFSGNPIQDIQAQTNGETLPEVRDYARYWHGYLVWLRPMLAHTTWANIRLTTLLMLSLCLLLAVALYAKQKGVAYAMAFGLPIIGYFFPQAGISPQLSSVYFVGLLASILLLSVPKFRHDFRWASSLFLLTGCATSFVDLLTAPMMGLLLPLLTYAISAPRTKEHYRDIALLVGIWLAAYLGFWFMKWVIATCLTDLDVIQSGLHNSRVRSYGWNDDFYTWWTVFERVWEWLCEPFVWMPMSVAAILWIVGLRPQAVPQNLYLLLLALVPVLWMFVLRQHTAYHFYHLAWRNLIPSIMAVLLFMVQTNRFTNKD